MFVMSLRGKLCNMGEILKTSCFKRVQKKMFFISSPYYTIYPLEGLILKNSFEASH